MSERIADVYRNSVFRIPQLPTRSYGHENEIRYILFLFQICAGKMLGAARHLA